MQAFQRGEGEVFLISLKAGGFGLNLTAADHVLIVDPWWNPAAEDQAMGRTHRIGQQRPVTVYRLVTAGSIEERIVELHGDKRSLADGILEDQGDATALSAQALRELLLGDEADGGRWRLMNGGAKPAPAQALLMRFVRVLFLKHARTNVFRCGGDFLTSPQ